VAIQYLQSQGALDCHAKSKILLAMTDDKKHCNKKKYFHKPIRLEYNCIALAM
jgi:hypothetical protein